MNLPNTIEQSLCVKDNPKRHRTVPCLFSFTWANGRQLVNIEKDNNALATYTYNADGLRTSKTVNGVTTNYYWINGILQGQKTGDEYIIFLYDENGTAYGMLIKNSTTESTYYYVRNLQGDIIGILDSSGTQVVSYTYGAWGDILSVGGSLATTIGQQNPLRYRGYYYDSETGFYYLQSRYYDTVTQRFVNGDSLLNNEYILGYNQFTYCNNNPVMYDDITGFLAFPGEIHNEVVKYIANKLNLFKEQFIIYPKNVFGRADLISKTGEVWDVKPNKKKHIKKGEKQVEAYTEGIWHKQPNIKLKVGSEIKSGSFVYSSGITNYHINYMYARNGVITYDYYETTNWNEVVAPTVVTVLAVVGISILTYFSGGAAAPAFALIP